MSASAVAVKGEIAAACLRRQREKNAGRNAALRRGLRGTKKRKPTETTETTRDADTNESRLFYSSDL